MTVTESRIKTRHEFIAELAAQSSAIAAMALKKKRITEASLGSEAFKLANCAAHRRLIVRAVEGLISNRFSSIDNVRNLLADVIRGNTYGAFAELAGYEWIMRCQIRSRRKPC